MVQLQEMLSYLDYRFWSKEAFVGDTKTVDVHIRWLREKIEVTPSAPELIQTVRGFGYRFG